MSINSKDLNREKSHLGGYDGSESGSFWTSFKSLFSTPKKKKQTKEEKHAALLKMQQRIQQRILESGAKK